MTRAWSLGLTTSSVFKGEKLLIVSLGLCICHRTALQPTHKELGISLMFLCCYPIFFNSTADDPWDQKRPPAKPEGLVVMMYLFVGRQFCH